jgi:hypothetical protein
MASRVILLDVAWNPTVDQQAIARAWRVGQTREVFVYRLFCTNAIELAQLSAQNVKDSMAVRAIDKGKLRRKIADAASASASVTTRALLTQQDADGGAQAQFDDVCAEDDVLRELVANADVRALLADVRLHDTATAARDEGSDSPEQQQR